MIHLGLVGYPLDHSLSPTLHHAALQASGLQGEYSPYPVHREDALALHDLINRVRTGELNGLNVTIPHKQAVMEFLDELSPAASVIGAVNTIYLKDGKIVGDNTDSAGFLTDLNQFLANLPRSSIVLGAGGAARAVVYALWNSGCEVTVAARRIGQAHELTRQFANVRSLALSPQGLEGVGARLIVNATPLGMFPDVESCSWPAGLSIPEDAAVYDLVYNPRETLLVRKARLAGLRAISGLGMLVEQAALAFELWTGRTIRRELLFDAIRQTAF